MSLSLIWTKPLKQEVFLQNSLVNANPATATGMRASMEAGKSQDTPMNKTDTALFKTIINLFCSMMVYRTH